MTAVRHRGRPRSLWFAGVLGADDGAASIVAVGLLAASVSLVVTVVAASGALVERHRLAAAADAAALAAADTASGYRPGVPCDEARRVTEANDAVLVSCSIDGSTATVRAESSRGILPIGAAATAGQPPAEVRRTIGASQK